MRIPLAILIALAGCGHKDGNQRDPDPSGVPPGCPAVGTPTGTGTGATGTDTGQTFPEPTMSLRGTAPGARVFHAWGIEVSSAVEGRVLATIDDGNGHVRVLEPPETGTDFTATLVGFRSDRDYTITAQLWTPDCAAPIGSPQVFQVSVPPLPPDLPELTVSVNDGQPRGDTMFGVQGAPRFYILRVDSDGEVVWYMDLDGRSLDVTLEESGRLLLEENGVVNRTSWLGDNPQVIQPAPQFIAYHHEVATAPNGGFFTLAEQLQQVDNLPADYALACGPGTTEMILNTVVVEIDAAGSVVNEWNVADRMDTHRIGWGSLAVDEGGFDWGHGNAVVYVPADDSLVISLRSQDTQFKLSRATGEVQWILAPPQAWAPEFEALRLQPADPGFQWLYHGHAPEPDGNRMLVFDNGNFQATPCGSPSGFPITNRAVELEIDEVAGTVREVWSWTPGLFSPVMGDADRLEDDHVLVTFGQLSADELGVFATRGLGSKGARVAEVDPSTNAVVWELRINSDGVDLPGGWSAPRAERIPLQQALIPQ